MTGRDGGRTPAPRVVHARLQSWKEIAAYLQRDERTVRRWEKAEGLPVHRLQHGKLGSVFANPAELDDWLANRTDTHAKRSHGEEAASHRLLRYAPALALMVGGIALIAAAWIAIRSAPHEADTLTIVPFTSHPGTELEPALSRDGNQVAYVWDGDNQLNFDVYVGLVSGGSAVRVTSNPAKDYSPAWSPDGTSIAFLRQAGAASAALFVVPALGGPERLITYVSTPMWPQWNRPGPFLTWSRDGKWLIVVGRFGGNATDRILRVDAASGDVRPITSPPGNIMGDTGPAVAPDGSTLAFSRRESWGVSRLCVLPLTREMLPAGAVTTLDTGSTWNASPAWTPSGGELIFSTGRMDSPHLASIGLSSGSRPDRLRGAGDYGWHPSLASAPGGKPRLVFTRHFESVNIWRQPVDAGPAVELIKSAHWSYEPDYSRDGGRIAFLSDRSGSAEVWASAADGRNPQQWTFLKHPNLGAPKWSPDGRQIAFTAPGEDGSSIYLVDRAGSSPRMVRDSHRCGYINWSPDGAALYFSSNRRNGTQIWKVGLDGGDAVQVTATGGRVPVVSADGRFLYYMRMVNAAGENHLFRMPLAGGAEEKVLESVDAYSVSSTGIAFRYYRSGAQPDGPRHRFLRFSTGALEELPYSGKRLRYGIAVSPDGQHIIYSQSDYEVSDVMLVEGLG